MVTPATQAVKLAFIPADNAPMTANGYKDGPVAATVVDIRQDLI